MGITRVVSVDGGGVRGIIPVVVMQRLAAEPGLESWLDRTELMAGTSTGGLIALCIAAGVPLDDLHDLYVTRARVVFKDSLLDDLRDVGKVFGADYDVANLEGEAHRVLGERTLAQLTKRVLVPDVRPRQRRDDRPALEGEAVPQLPGPRQRRRRCSRIASPWPPPPPRRTSRRTTATSTAASSRRTRACARSRRRRTRASCVGAGRPRGRAADLVRHRAHPEVYRGRRLDWGYWQWVRPLLDVMLDGVNGIADYQCTQLLGGHYHRLAPTFPPDKSIGMDAVAQIPYLVDFANHLDLSATADWLRANW